MDPRLATLVDRLWGPGEAAGSPVVVTTGPVPSTHRLVEEYAVVPSLCRPRYLLPLRSRPAVEAALTSHLSTTGPRSRAAATALAATWSTGAGPALWRDRLRVGVDHRAVDPGAPAWTLLEHLAADLDEPDLVTVVPVRRATPNAKPTARVFRPDGTARGFLKVGWSGPTRTLVDDEAATLRALDGAAGDLEVPRLATSGQWRDRAFHLARPLPAGLTSWDGAPTASVGPLLGVASAGTTARTGTERLEESAWVGTVAERLRAATVGVPVESTALAAGLGRLLRGSQGRTPVRFGRWHGDWVPWNLGQRAGRRMVWDWEYSTDAAPVGFDLLHWHFQRRLARPDATLVPAVDAAWAARHQLALLGVPPEHHDLLVRLYVVEILTRACWLAGHGSGWNPKLHPELLTAAAAGAA